ncbi:MAG: DUF998 domain-containing protein [Rhodobacteraceae bacterium]|nr:DUF998 domain-containing protein [Paracoccaceae bacterium]
MTADRRGAILWVLCLQYFAAEAVVAQGYRGPYALATNYISDLGATTCAAVCSPLHPLMNASFLLQGVLIASGALLVRNLFPRGPLATAALACIAASALGVILVGIFPEDSGSSLHYNGAAENFLLSNLGMVLAGLALRPVAPARALYSLASGLIGLAGLMFLAMKADLGLGIGTVERITAYPFPLWLGVTGLWLLRRTG